MNEVNVQPIDLGDELRQRVEPRFHLAPVVVGRPVLRELRRRRQLYALGVVRDGFLVGPAGRSHAPAQIVEQFPGIMMVKGRIASAAAAPSAFGTMLMRPTAAVAARSSRPLGEVNLLT